MEGPRAHGHVIGLQDDAARIGPVALQLQNEVLECSRTALNIHVALPPRNRGASIVPRRRHMHRFAAFTSRRLGMRTRPVQRFVTMHYNGAPGDGASRQIHNQFKWLSVVWPWHASCSYSGPVRQ